MLERPTIDSETADLVSDTLRQWHIGSAAAPLRAAGDIGSWFDGLLLHREALAVVVDANVLRNDILYACRKKQRTTLITAANTGALRIYVAEHVVREIHEHAVEWCKEQNCDPFSFHERFKNEYLPRLQVIPRDAIPLSILVPDELRRIDKLSRCDTDDIPSVVLSLSLGAPFLSMDEAPWEAVYGEYRSYEDLQNWRDTLTAGSDASVLAKALFITLGTPVAGAIGLVQGVRYLAARAPWVLVLGIGVAAYTAFRAPHAAWSALRAGFGRVGTTLYEAQRLYEVAFEQFRAAAPSTPSWEQQQGLVDKRALLLRASLRTLAHSATTDMSAQSLADALPKLRVAQSAPIVRATLRDSAAFSQAARGKWRVGHTYRFRA